MRCEIHASLIVVLSHLYFYLYMIAANHNYNIALHKRKMIFYNFIFILYDFSFIQNVKSKLSTYIH